MIALIDAGCGNLRSVQRALEAVGARDVTLTRDPDAIARADRAVFPGQGAFGDCARALDADGGALREAILAVVSRGAPFLGICLGMQVLFDTSEEAPGARGLGVLPGHVARIPDGLTDLDGSLAKIPHMGWNLARATVHHPGLFAPHAGDWFYFVHSFHCVPEDPSVIAATSRHGVEIVCAVARDSLLAVQFHPEKSQDAGKSLLARWLAGDPRP
jgi:glutamine amidotransferase